MKVSLFITCLSDALYPRVGEAMVRLLAKYGVQVEFPDRSDLLRPAGF